VKVNANIVASLLVGVMVIGIIQAIAYVLAHYGLLLVGLICLVIAARWVWFYTGRL